MAKTFGRNTEKIMVILPPELKLRIERFRNEKKVSISAVTRELLDKYLEKEGY